VTGSARTTTGFDFFIKLNCIFLFTCA